MTRRRLALLILTVTAAQLIVGLALIVVQPEPTCPAFQSYSSMYGRCYGNVEFDRPGTGFLAADSAALMLLFLVVLFLLLWAVAALLVAEARRAAVGSGRMRRHLFALVLVVLTLFLWAVAGRLLDPLMLRQPDGPRSVIMPG
jgi:hypothetical protein